MPTDARLIRSVLACATLGALGCWLIIVTAAEFRAAYLASRLFVPWSVMVLVLGALAGAGVVPVRAVIASESAEGRRRGLSARLSAVLCLAALVVTYIVVMPGWFPNPALGWPAGDDYRRIDVCTLLVLVPALMAVYAMWLLASSAAALPAACATRGLEDPLHAYLDYRHTARELLHYTGALLGTGTLATGLLRKAMLAAGHASDASFPKMYVMAFGAFYAVVLVIAYWPVHLLFSKAGEQLCGALLAAEATAQRGLSPLAWCELRVRARRSLELDTSTIATVRQALAILGPLVGALLSEVL